MVDAGPEPTYAEKNESTPPPPGGGWTVGWMDGWMNGCMDGRTENVW